jgi:DNA-binding transcriptional MocR family regulator
MSIWAPDIGQRTGPRYLAIADALADDVANGRLTPGTRLPPQRDLAWQLKVTVGTIARAYTEAARRGLISGEVGRGTYVLDAEATDQADGLTALHQTLAAFHARPADENSFIDMSINRPTGDNAARLIADAMRRLAESPDLSRLLGYRIDSPWPRQAAAGARWLARDGVEASPDQVTLTVGGQQAIFSVMAALSQPGETVFAEELTYPGIKRTGSLIDRPIVGIPMDEGGMLPDALDAALAKHPRSLVYCMATLHNPTAVTMPLERRKSIAAVARRHDATLVEDGIYAFLDEHAPPPLWTLAPERCVYMTSLSKAVSPGLRVGFVFAPPHLQARVAATVAATTMMVPAVLAEIAAMMIEDGSAERAAMEQRIEAAARMEIARAILGAEHCPKTPSDNLWLALPPAWRPDSFAAEASRRGVLVTQAAAFAVGPRVPKAVRVSISAPRDRDQLRAGLETLARLMADSPDRLTLTV